MEIGSLADWVTGISELLAVCVALFLPMFRRKREVKAIKNRIYTFISLLAERIIEEKIRKPTIEVKEMEKYKELDKFIEIVMITDGDILNIDSLYNIRELLLSLDESISDIQQKRAEIRKVMGNH